MYSTYIPIALSNLSISLSSPDCQYFYICIGGVSARRNGCTVGLVFNPEKLSCDRPRNVQGPCRNWYNETFLEQNAPAESPKRPVGERTVIVVSRIIMWLLLLLLQHFVTAVIDDTDFSFTASAT